MSTVQTARERLNEMRAKAKLFGSIICLCLDSLVELFTGTNKVELDSHWNWNSSQILVAVSDKLLLYFLAKASMQKMPAFNTFALTTISLSNSK